MPAADVLIYQIPLLLRWQGLLHPAPSVLKRLEKLAGFLLVILLGSLPILTRPGLALLLIASGLLWVVWSVATPAGRINGITVWLLIILSIAILATGTSPVPIEATKGLLKLLGYLGVYALMYKLLKYNPTWWDRLLAGLLSGGLLSSTLALRQLYGNTEELATWADPNSITTDTIRIYGTLGNPNLLAGYLLPLLPLAAVALLRWTGCGSRIFATVTLILAGAATTLTYSRGGWLGMTAGLTIFVLLLLAYFTREWRPIWRQLLTLGVLLISTVILITVVTKFESIHIRITSLLVGRSDSSNNFRINVWLAVADMVRDRPWLGIGPGNNAFQSVYPLYQQPRFDALSAYSVPLEILVEMGLPGLIACLGLLSNVLGNGLASLRLNRNEALAGIACLATIGGLLMQGITDTIFFRPEVQIIGWFAVATLASRPKKA
ncbi:IctB family putative bicarbonate transporter [Synechococcus sp. M16CYN]|uniref:IctB family putative bicarbonate transporter n=1 Tax=Synechococcus sp. M16CYN TaxID=3103139 RepID=UPI00324D2076